MTNNMSKGFPPGVTLVFITTGRFTPEARKEATRQGAPPIDLVDGERLCDLLKELKMALQPRPWNR
jgi:restriction system protein